MRPRSTVAALRTVHAVRVAAWAWLLAVALGCGDRRVRFAPDELLHAQNGLTAAQSESIHVALAGLFGSPDEPVLPVDPPRTAELCDHAALRQAAGAVASHTVGVVHGLYRRHCARCHGVTGDGRGPTALYQAPYPRDFRRGVFKWKSTYRDAPPTTEDLDRVIESGIPGTAMPSFRLLSAEERSALRQYVVYLAIRGETERALVGLVADELPAGETLRLEGDLRREVVEEVVSPIVEKWITAADRVVAAPVAPSGGAGRGRELYHSERAGCAKCHGDEGLGGAAAGIDYEIDFDLWTRDRVAAPPDAAVRRLVARDLPARPATPRGLINETPRGGATAADLFRRVHQGVAGTPMPAVGSTGPTATGALSDDEVVDLVAYLESLR